MGLLSLSAVLSLALHATASLACGKAQPPAVPQGALIALDEDAGVLALIDVASGETLAEVSVSGPNAWALYRPSTGEILVSDFDRPGGEVHLLVFEVRQPYAPSRSIPMPDRSVSTGYAPAWALSDDERYIYYAARDPADLYANWIVVIDLEAGREVTRVETPLGCRNYKTLISSGRSGVQVFCLPNRYVLVEADGGISSLQPLPLPVDRFETGATVGCLGPGNTMPCRLGNDRRVLAVREPDEGRLVRLVIYEERAPANIQEISLPEGIVHFAPVDAGTVALLEGTTGAAYLLDVASGDVTRELRAPAGSDWLVGP